MSKETTPTCRIAECDRPVEIKNAQLCKRCYSSFYYWRKKTPAHVVARAHKLKLYRARLAEFFPTLEIVQEEAAPKRRRSKA